ncbi:transaldolase [Glaciecola sp. XM2]|uniref:transaldolase n=1 Tax=Glaciecola sp. XM2 TaxID=1914931 RepID=UPI001BDF6A38|nr:transaldolase [Glaciecola sp. XM2]MBT1450436.1 transaldolase [Glaciecola sp. XM2]
MSNQLESLRALTTVVADTGDIEAIKKYQPVDATTNPSLLLKAAALPQYENLITAAIEYGKSQAYESAQQIKKTCDYLAVAIGKEIVDVIPGRISTEVDARLSFDTQATIDKAHELIALYKDAGVDKSRILIKVASTWEGIKAAEVLEKEGINCNLTLLFSFAQARACAEAGVFLISPFVGRILDWYKSKSPDQDFSGSNDPGVQSVSNIYQYYKEHGYKTVVMGASFRNTGEIISLAGCDRLTISPQLLEELGQTSGELTPMLVDNGATKTPSERLSEAAFRWDMNQDAMATEKLSEGIRNFAADQVKLEELLLARF